MEEDSFPRGRGNNKKDSTFVSSEKKALKRKREKEILFKVLCERVGIDNSEVQMLLHYAYLQ